MMAEQNNENDVELVNSLFALQNAYAKLEAENQQLRDLIATMQALDDAHE